jgi:hypothetical protein
MYGINFDFVIMLVGRNNLLSYLHNWFRTTVIIHLHCTLQENIYEHMLQSREEPGSAGLVHLDITCLVSQFSSHLIPPLFVGSGLRIGKIKEKRSLFLSLIAFRLLNFFALLQFWRSKGKSTS